MSRYQRVISLLIVWHVLSVSVASLASPDDIDRYRADARPTGDWISARVRPLADVAAGVLDPLSRALWQATVPARALTAVYGRALSVRQRWIMFVVPDRTLGYVRIRYYWQTGASGAKPQSLTEDELVFPHDREDRVRLVGAYWNSFHSKAMSSALQGFMADRNEGLAEYSPYLTPVLSFFGERFESEHLNADESLLRIELWHGLVQNPPPGARVPDETAAEHLEVLRSYYEGPGSRVVYGPIGTRRESIEREADIVWTLLDFQERP